MSTEIDFDDIQVRDTVTRDYRGVSSTLTVGIRDAMTVYPNFSGRADEVAVRNTVGSAWKLVDRPKPAVVLPIVPTLGWFNQNRSTGRRLGVFSAADAIADANNPALAEHSARGDVFITWYDVTAFVAATAVPTEDLDNLRAVPRCGKDIRNFLAAVDAANGPRA